LLLLLLLLRDGAIAVVAVAVAVAVATEANAMVTYFIMGATIILFYETSATTGYYSTLKSRKKSVSKNSVLTRFCFFWRQQY
jgi:hypothetical protein